MAKKKPPPTKGQLRKRAGRQARASSAPDQAAIDSARRQARRTYSTELGASRAAKQANKKLIRQAQAGIPGNIHGLALKQIQSDLSTRVEDAKGMVRYEKAGLKQDLRSTLSDLRQQQAALDAQTAADAQSILKDSIQKQREKRQAEIEKRTKYNREVQAALAEIRQQVAKTRGPGANSLRIEAATLRSDPALRRNLVDYLRTSQGISAPAAKKAVSLFTRGKNTAADEAGQAIVGLHSAATGTTTRPGFADQIAAIIAENPSWWEDKTP